MPDSSQSLKQDMARWLALISILLAISCGPPSPPDEEVLAPSAPTIPAVTRDDRMNTATFLRRLCDLSSMARSYPGEKMTYFTSHSSVNTDHSGTLIRTHREGDTEWNVLAEQEGPGCIARIWVGGAKAGRFRIFLDSEDTPAVDMTIEEFFSGKVTPFVQPLVYGRDEVSTGSSLCYFPIGFQSKCRIETSCAAAGLKYQIEIRTLQPETRIETFQMPLNPEANIALEELKTFFSIPAPNRFLSLSKQGERIQIKPKERKVLLTVTGPAALDYLEFTLDRYDTETLDQIRMEAFWDHLQKASIDCSLLDFFDSRGLSQTSWNYLTLGQSVDMPSTPETEYQCLYTQFYMPFQEKAQIILENQTDTPITVSLRYHTTFENLPNPFCYFFAQSAQRKLLLGQMYPLFDFIGKGNFVGYRLISLTEPFPRPFFHLSGSNYFYRDGEPDPSFLGTSTDNLFNTDIREEGFNPFYVQQYGCLAKQEVEGGFTNYFRLLLMDSIPFETSLVWAHETGNPILFTEEIQEKPVFTNYHWICYWYAAPIKTDSISRKERLFYYTVDQNPETALTKFHPLLRGNTVNFALEKGAWWLHTAPVWDAEQVTHTQKTIE